MMGRCYSAARGFLLHRPALRGSRGMLVGTALIALGLAGCGPSYQSARWDGRRGYDGNAIPEPVTLALLAPALAAAWVTRRGSRGWWISRIPGANASGRTTDDRTRRHLSSGGRD